MALGGMFSGGGRLVAAALLQATTGRVAQQQVADILLRNKQDEPRAEIGARGLP